MHLTINDKIKTNTLQRSFSKMFPFLRLVIYLRKSEGNSVIFKPMPSDKIMTLSTCRTKHNSGNVEITPGTTVNELVQCLFNQYGLAVEVMRQSGNAWLETTITKSWTLMEQNEQGKSLSQHLSK
jgi:hypothetical protein